MATRSRRRTALRTVLALLVLVVLATAYAGWRAWQVRGELQAAREAASRMRDALEARDVEGAQAALTDLRAHSAAAADGTDGGSFSLLARVPVLGDDVQAVRAVSRVLDDLAGDGLGPLVAVAERYRDGSLAPRAGRVPVRQVQALHAPVRASRETFVRARDDLAAVETDGLLAQVADATVELRGIVDDGIRSLRSVEDAVRLLPSFLGADGPRRYLLVLENNAEIRSTGGFAGSAFLLEARKGAIRLATPAPGRTFPVLAEPILPLTPAETALFDEAGTRFVNANLIPDFPRASELWSAHWQRRFGQQVDGVIATDPVTLSYLLAVSGPIHVGGVELSAATAVSELLSATYARHSDPDAQDAFFQLAGEAAFAAVTSIDDVEGLVRALQRSAREGRLLVHSERRAEQAILDRSGVSGALETGTAGPPQVGVYLNDRTGTTGSKLSYFLRHEATIRSTSCEAGVQTLTGELRLRSTAPASGLPLYVTGGSPEVPLGTQGLAIYLMGPAKGRIGRVTVDGRPTEARVVRYRGRPAVRVDYQLAAGASGRIEWRMRTVARQRGDVELTVTPGVLPGDLSASVPTSCDA